MLTEPPPINIDFMNDVIGGSGSPPCYRTSLCSGAVD